MGSSDTRQGGLGGEEGGRLLEPARRVEEQTLQTARDRNRKRERENK